jgi:hypothetical protein
MEATAYWRSACMHTSLHFRCGYCYQHVQAIIVAIDQYAETALGNRGYFSNKPHSIGGKNDKIP